MIGLRPHSRVHGELQRGDMRITHSQIGAPLLLLIVHTTHHTPNPPTPVLIEVRSNDKHRARFISRYSTSSTSPLQAPYQPRGIHKNVAG